jgi:hypothetical protein
MTLNRRKFIQAIVLCLIVSIALSSLVISCLPSLGANQRSQTFGSGNVDYPESPPPDLVLAHGENGAVGYVYENELHDNPLNPAPSTPDEAAEYIRRQAVLESEARARGDAHLYYIPLYESDGVTVIGQFGVGKVTYEE